jgi:hypothetical protein
MIRRVADTVQISYHCEHLGDDFVYSLKIVYGRKAIRTLQRPIPQDADGMRDLVQSWSDELIAYEALTKKRHLAELPPYGPGHTTSFEILLNRTRELDNQKSASLNEIYLRIERARQANRAPDGISSSSDAFNSLL